MWGTLHAGGRRRRVAMTSLGLGDVVVRLGVALALGVLVGVEREYREPEQ